MAGAASGNGTITYTDGTTRQFTITFPDWWSNTASPGGDILATLPYINAPSGKENQQVSVYYAGVPLQRGKTVAYVTLPDVSQGPGAEPARDARLRHRRRLTRLRHPAETHLPGHLLGVAEPHFTARTTRQSRGASTVRGVRKEGPDMWIAFWVTVAVVFTAGCVFWQRAGTRAAADTADLTASGCRRSGPRRRLRLACHM